MNPLHRLVVRTLPLVPRSVVRNIASRYVAGETLDEAAVVRVLSDRIPLPTTPGARARVHLTKPDDVAWADLDVVVFVQAETGAVGAAVQLPAR